MPISGKEMCKLFIKLGYEIVPGGGKGSHTKLQKEGFPTIIIPGHKELKIKTEHGLRKQLKKIEKELTS